MEPITIDGMDEDAFRHSVEDMLRLDMADEALVRLRALLEPYAHAGGILPARMLEVSPGDVEFGGWARLADRLVHHDRPNYPISAIGVALADARVLGGPGPRDGKLAPFLKTFYFSDDAYPFTDATREDLLDGYSREGFGWQGDYQATDATLSIKGIDDLHGAIVSLEDRLLDSANPSDDEIRAGTIGACYLAALIHQALRATIRKQGLPRPLCVFAACDGVYPFFDAPVAGWDDCEAEVQAVAVAEEAAEDVWPNEIEDAVPLADAQAAERFLEGSLLNIVSRRGTKQLALAIGEEDRVEALRFNEEASASRLVVADDTVLRGLFHGRPASEITLPPLAKAPAEAVATGRDDEDRTAPSPGLAGADYLAAGLTPHPQPAEAADLATEDWALTPEAAVAAAETTITMYEPVDPRTQFRLAEAAGAFPTGRSLRQRIHSDQVREPQSRPNPLQAIEEWWKKLDLTKGLRGWARQQRRRIMVRLGRRRQRRA